MTRKHLLFCALTGGLVAAGAGCSSIETPDTPVVEGFEDYSMTTMANGRVQLYGATEYTFTAECIDSDLEVIRKSSADAVWFDYSIVEDDTIDGKVHVTITPDEDPPWSAKVKIRCAYSNYRSDAEVVNFCFEGPCSDEDKP